MAIKKSPESIAFPSIIKEQLYQEIRGIEIQTKGDFSKVPRGFLRESNYFFEI